VKRVHTLGRRFVAALGGFALLFALAACTLPTADADVVAVETVDAGDCAQLFALTPDPEGPALVIVVDPTASALDRGFPAELSTAIYDAALKDGSVSMVAVDGLGAAPNWILTDVALNDSSLGEGVSRHQRIAELAPACVEREAHAARPTKPGSDILTALALSAIPGRTGTVWIDSDGLSSAGVWDLNRTIVGSVPAAEVGPALAATGELPHWSVWDVVYSGLGGSRGPVISQTALTWIQDAYLSICVAAGADECSVAEGVIAGTPRLGDLPEDAPVALPPRDTVTLRGDACVYTLPGISFQADLSFLSAEARLQIADLAGLLEEPNTSARIVGHTHGTGPDDPLALERALAVQGVLLDEGIGQSQLEAMGVGGSQPIGSPEENRRVEVEVYGLASCR
jgi:outer membrane protein OmpA-like peptidoglycan-associated protein